MGLIAQLLKSSSTSCKIADAAVAGAMDPEELTALKGPDGERTVSFLFSFGATCMERSGLEWACSMANILQGLVNAVAWRDSLLSHITNSIQSLREKEVLDLSSIFALFVIAGFPEVLSIGNQVKYNENGTEARLGVVLKHYPDKHMTLLIDTKSRKRHSVSFIDYFGTLISFQYTTY
ncbi:zinc finger ZZ-type and EF-hand domain-containing protein 1-like [Lingula anatina]|uniref:Zinc finger ZZ-type and EF-hand domain-containing protein 1-like n=1 Tax=Lingula anatina TaxID=7574 RepID=A0A1S3IKD2_LINAN|nr:zinc finger ZZ-type and EF-hand domain-containing protein 1-like [Lingula anatina]|eukprot:XP_013398346.1 zinc finger ZZ-type and EF-hand domain-containing protein 1-like [Lingula anatina]